MIKNISVFLLCALASCGSNKKVQQTRPWVNPLDYAYNTLPVKLTFDKQGHRGCRGLMPENTIPAMLKALELGVTTLEMDVVITQDKKVLLSHEAFFSYEITTKPDGSYVTEAEEKTLKLYHMDYEQVKTYDVGLKPHPRFPLQEKVKAIKPLLVDVFDEVKKYASINKKPIPFFNIETKSEPSGDILFHPKPDEFVELLMHAIKEKQMEQYVIIQSFDVRTLQYLHKQYPLIKTALLQEEFDITLGTDYIKKLGFKPDYYSPAYNKVTLEMIKACHEKNVKIIPWTVNDKSKIEELIIMGVDGIITDYPDLFSK